MPISNTYIQPQDGWQLLVTDPAFIRVSIFPPSHPFYLYKGGSVPTTQTGGLLANKFTYSENVTDTDSFYVRIADPAPDNLARIDTFWIAGGAPVLSILMLENGTDSLALENGTDLIALES